MISAQKEVEFAKSDYDNLKPVRSIWICMDAGDYDYTYKYLIIIIAAGLIITQLYFGFGKKQSDK